METAKAVRIGRALAEADLVIIGASNGLDMAEGSTFSAPMLISKRRTGTSPRQTASAAYCRACPWMPACDADGPSGFIKRNISNMSPARS